MTKDESKRELEKDLLCLLLIKNFKPESLNNPKTLAFNEGIHRFHEAYRVLLTELLKSDKFKRLYGNYDLQRNNIIYLSNNDNSGATGTRRTGTLF